MNKKYIDSWIDIAIKDVEASKVLYNSKLYSNSFYHFQQASEKALKAYAFMTNAFTSEKDARSTSHYILKVFKDSMQKRQEEILFLKEFELDNIFEGKILEDYSSNLDAGLNELPKEKDMLEFSNGIIVKILKTLEELKDLKKYKYKFPNDIKEILKAKMDLVFDLVSKHNQEIGTEAKNEFKEFIQEENNIDEIIEMAREKLKNTLIENYYVLILYFSNLISHNHNNLTRYPEVNFNPLKYYNLNRPIIKRLPEISEYLFTALIYLKKINKLYNFE